MKTIVCDVDGVLTLETEGHTKTKYQQRTPNLYNIETLRDYHTRGFKIVIYSARFEQDFDLTYKYLKQYQIPFDEVILGKPQADSYVDDRATNQLDREVLCFSGGVDSLIAYHFLDFPTPLYVKIHHRYQTKEIEGLINLRKLIPKLVDQLTFCEGPDLSRYEVGDKAYISLRNVHLATMASYYGNKIYICGVKGDKVEDKSSEAFNVLSHALNFVRKKDEPKISIESPFWNMTKTDIIKWFLDNYRKKT